MNEKNIFQKTFQLANELINDKTSFTELSDNALIFAALSQLLMGLLPKEGFNFPENIINELNSELAIECKRRATKDIREIALKRLGKEK